MSRRVNLIFHKNVKQKNNFELKISTWERADQQLRELKLRTGVRNTRAIASVSIPLRGSRLTFCWDWFANSEFCNGRDAYSTLLVQTVRN
jgi:hypothetical protein